MAAVEIEWADPPPEAFVNDAKGRIIAALKQRPGHWARLKKDMASTAPKNVWVKLGCEVVIHRTNPGVSPARYDLYAKIPLPPAKPLGPAGQAAASGRAIIPPTPGDAAERLRREREARGVSPDGKPLSSLKPV